MITSSVRFVRGCVDASGFPVDELPFVIIAGRSNCGKSSLVNALFNNRTLARVSSTPGRTAELNFFLVGERWFLVDLPGYGYAARGRDTRGTWSGAVEALFADRRATLVLLLADVRREPEDEEVTVGEMARAAGVPLRMVLTKRDKVGRGEFGKLFSAWQDFVGGLSRPLVTSAKSREGLEELARSIEARVDEVAKKDMKHE